VPRFATRCFISELQSSAAFSLATHFSPSLSTAWPLTESNEDRYGWTECVSVGLSQNTTALLPVNQCPSIYGAIQIIIIIIIVIIYSFTKNGTISVYKMHTRTKQLIVYYYHRRYHRLRHKIVVICERRDGIRSETFTWMTVALWHDMVQTEFMAHAPSWRKAPRRFARGHLGHKMWHFFVCSFAQ